MVTFVTPLTWMASRVNIIARFGLQTSYSGSALLVMEMGIVSIRKKKYSSSAQRVATFSFQFHTHLDLWE